MFVKCIVYVVLKLFISVPENDLRDRNARHTVKKQFFFWLFTAIRMSILEMLCLLGDY